MRYAIVVIITIIVLLTGCGNNAANIRGENPSNDAAQGNQGEATGADGQGNQDISSDIVNEGAQIGGVV